VNSTGRETGKSTSKSREEGPKGPLATDSPNPPSNLALVVDQKFFITIDFVPPAGYIFRQFHTKNREQKNAHIRVQMREVRQHI